MRFRKTLILNLLACVITACANFNPQYKNKYRKEVFPESKIIKHSFYLIGDSGHSPIGSQTEALKSFKVALAKASKQSTAIFLGDNVYPNGVPEKAGKQHTFAMHQLKAQTEAVKGFEGNTIFIPGNKDWNSGLKGLKRQEEFIENALGENSFLPKNGCPITEVTISDDIVIILIDSHWFLTNWDKHPTINDDCDIKTRIQFFDEFERLVKKTRGKTTVIAMHHPLFTNGPHGGQYSLKEQLSPAPLIGSLKNVLRKTSGSLNADVTNKRYHTFKKQLVALSQENDKLIFVSGHERSLQYLFQDNLPQIVSGSGSKPTATRNNGGGQFSYGTPGYARLDVFNDGTSYVRFFSAKDGEIVFQTQVLSPRVKENSKYNTKNYPQTTTAFITSKKETEKPISHRVLWGNRYRKEYSVKIKAKTVSLDTLYGGLKPIGKLGGHHSRSLLLKNEKGQEFVMHALKKNAIQYLQSIAFDDQYIEGQFNDTYTKGLLNDIFKGAHPYAPFTIGSLSGALGIFHTNPTLYYVPKQKALGNFNKNYGNTLYLLEEQVTSGHGDKANFGFANTIINTKELLLKLRESPKHKVDESAYIRARLFDMLIGDWERHENQWRWAVFSENDETIYRPIPIDREQAFSLMGDGVLLDIGTRLSSRLRMLKNYDGELKNPKAFNLEAFPLDVALINKSDKAVWEKEVEHLTKNLTKEVIAEAFSFFPPEIDQYDITLIKEKLIKRRDNLKEIANKYYNALSKFVVVKGTDKKDTFLIERQANGGTKIRISNSSKEVFFQKSYTKRITKEIWIYGLDEDDEFKIIGRGSYFIPIRIIGGQNIDRYHIENERKVTLYDYETEKNKFTGTKGKKRLNNNYETNVYNYKKLKTNENQFRPIIGSNPDDGLKLGLAITNTLFGIERKPYTRQHRLKAAYFFGTKGFDFNYSGQLVTVLQNWNLGVELGFTSPNYSVNFFGFGNGSQNLNFTDRNNFSLSYNRVRQSSVLIAPSLTWNGDLGAQFSGRVSFESVSIQSTNNRFIDSFFNANAINLKNNFAGVEGHYFYANKDNDAFPTLGMETSLVGGLKANVSFFDVFAYLKPSIAFDYKLIPSGQLVLATKSSGHFNFGNGFEFYQGANLGASNGLRGYRNQRFTGKNAFVQTTDLRLNLRRIKTRLLPLNVGIYSGTDFGRVWIKENDSRKWRSNYGGGLFFNAANKLVGNLSVFKGDERLRVAFKLGFGF